MEWFLEPATFTNLDQIMLFILAVESIILTTFKKKKS